MKPRGARSGTGVVLVVIFGVLLVMMMWALGMNTLSSGTTRQSHRAQIQERCNDLAQMALTEAIHFLRTRANSQDFPEVFETLRDVDPEDLELDLADLPLTFREMERTKRYVVSPVDVHIPRRTSLGREAEERVHYEAAGIARLTVTVRGPEGAKVTRVEEYGFRSVLTAPARPLDMLTFYLGDPSGLLSKNQVDGSANATMQQALENSGRMKQHYEEWERRANHLIQVCRDVADEPLANAGHLNGTADRIERELVPLLQKAREYRENAEGHWPMPDWELVGVGQGSPGDHQVHEFADDLVVYTAAAELDLSILNLPKLIGEKRKEVVDLEKTSLPHHEEMVRIWELYKQPKSVPPASRIDPDIESFIQATKEHVRLFHQMAGVLDGMLTDYKVFQDALIEVGGAERERIQKRIRRLDPLEQPWRTHFRFVGPGAAEKATRFLARRPAPSGVVLVNDPEERLTIDIQGLTGRLQVISAGPVDVLRATVADRRRDVLILTGYSEVDVAGPVEAAIISWGGSYGARGQGLHGSLILDSIHAQTSDASLEEILGGTLTRQEAILSGPTGVRRRPPPAPWALHVAFSPVPPYLLPNKF